MRIPNPEGIGAMCDVADIAAAGARDLRR